MSQIIKVLLIEDNRIEARATQHRLKVARDCAFDVTWVEQLQPGFERLAQGGIDIVLLDLNLPDSAGLETFVRLRAQAPDVPVVVMTGEYDETIGPMAVERGAQDYLVKHQADGALPQVLRFALGRHRAQLEMAAAARRQQQAEMAREVQMRMLPRFRPEVSGYTFWDYYQAAGNVGGDYFSYCQLPDQRIAISIADVCGKGIAAALAMAELCSEVRHALEKSPDASEAISRLNQQFCDREMFITFLLCVLDPRRHTLTVCNAGHMPPLRKLGASGEVESLSLTKGALPLGVHSDEVYESDIFAIQPGEQFVLFTDGITEAQGQTEELFGHDHLMAALRGPLGTAEHTVRGLIREVEVFRGPQPQSDDMCLLSFGRDVAVRREARDETGSGSRRGLVVPAARGFADFDQTRWPSLETLRVRAAGGASPVAAKLTKSFGDN